MRTFGYLLVCCLAISCGAQKSSIKMGQTNRTGLLAEKGNDFKEEETPLKDTRVLVFKNNEKYQLKGNMVVNSIKDPSPNQKLLLFWKNKFKDCNTQLTKLPQEEGQHTSVQMQMSCPAQGLSVIYTDGSDVISRVVEFESK